MKVHYHVFFLRLFLGMVAMVNAVYVYVAGMPEILYAVSATVLILTQVLLSCKETQVNATYNAHWADKKEIEPLKTSWGQNRDGILLGWSHGELLALKPGLFNRKELGHVLICAPSRKGKGLHITSNLLHWQHSAVVIDIKGELYRMTAGYRQAMGQKIIMLSPSGQGNRYDPFAELKTDEAIRSVVNVILDPEADGSNSAFARRAANILTAAFKGALTLKQPVLPFVRAVTAKGIEGCCRELYLINDPVIRTGVVDFLGKPPSEYDWGTAGNDKFLQNSWSGMIAKLVNLFSPGILHMTSGSDFRAIDLVKEPTTVYLVFNESELEFTGQAFQTVVLALINSLIRSFDQNPDMETIPLAWFFDEAGRLSVPKLDDLVSTVAGRGMTALIYVQSLGQLEGPYGKHGAKTILDNTHTKLFYTPIDDEMRQTLSDMTGKIMVGEDSFSSEGKTLQVNQNAGLTARPLLNTDELKVWPDERIFMDIPSMPPVVGHRLAPYLMKHGNDALRMPPPKVPVYEGGTIQAKLPSEIQSWRPNIPMPVPEAAHSHTDTPASDAALVSPTGESGAEENAPATPARGKVVMRKGPKFIPQIDGGQNNQP